MTTKQEYQALLKKYNSDFNLACWVDVLSTNQIRAIHRLANALRDDNLQGTSYRVRKLLEQIGLRPPMASAKLRVFIDLSRGSDLAFLYFILEGHYKSYEKCENFTRNEKLLMTAIMKLDLAFTIDALDKILPLPKKQKRNIQKSKLKQADDELQKPKTKPKKRLNYCELQKKLANKESPKFNPYFQKLMRPKRILLNLSCPVPKLRTRVNPTRFPRQDRWFARYELQPALRIVQNTLRRAVDCLLQSPDFPHIGDGKALCETHKYLKKESDLIKDALTLATRQRCLHLLNVSAHKDKLRLARILQQIEDDIDWYSAKYKNITRLQMTPTRMMRSNCNKSCEICRAMVTTMAEQVDMRVWYWEDNIERCATVATDTVKTISGPNAVFKHIHDEIVDPEGPQNSIVKRKKGAHSCLSGPVQRLLSVFNGCKMPEKIHKNEIPTEIGKPTPQYFKANTAHTAHSFYYMDIFPTKEKKPEYQKTIQKALKKALKMNSSEIADPKVVHDLKSCVSSQTLKPCSEAKPTRKGKRNRLSRSSSSSSLIENDFIKSDQYRSKKANLINTIVDCIEGICQSMFQHANEVAEEEVRERLLQKKNSSQEFDRLEYHYIKYFDPDNEELMNRLIFDGMAVLKGDRRFVLASFPDSHKLSDILEWTKRRYGKAYAHTELKRRFLSSLPIFRAVIKVQEKPPLVEHDDMPAGDLSYFQHERMMKISKDVKAQYADALNKDLFNNLKYVWLAMGGYLVARGPPKNLFYAYMPAKESEIYRVKMWKGERRDFRQYQQARLKKAAETIKL